LFWFNSSLSYHLQLILFPILIISYLIKLPVIPFHIWLPKFWVLGNF
jgi:NADH:ubiquinone oxidoreductase subunit 4 (subunit M)